MPTDDIILNLQQQIASLQNAINETAEALADLQEVKDDLTQAQTDLQAVLAACQAQGENPPPPDRATMLPINGGIATCADALRDNVSTLKAARKWIK